MLQLVLLGLSKWLVSSLFGGYIYQQAAKKFGKDKFQLITEKALNEVLKKDDNKLIWNKIMEKEDLKDDLTDFDFGQVCSWFSGKDKELCQNLFADLNREYLKQLCEVGKEDPVTKYLLDQVARLDDHEVRIRTLETIYPEILKLSERYHLIEKSLADVKKVIETRKLDIKDFVGRKDIIDDFPEGDVFIQGNAAFGKTYLLLMLCEQYDGYYIPLDTVNEREILDLLVREARDEHKRIFIDDFHCAGPEIQQFIQARVWDVVLSSREEPTIRRDFTCIKLSLLDEEDIKEYFSLYDIEIEEETLRMLKDDLNFPIKLRIFVNYLKRGGVAHLDNAVLGKILDDLGIQKFQLPDELHEFYRTFVFNLFDKRQKELCYVLSLLRFPASTGRLSRISHLSAGEVSGLLKKMRGVLKVHENRYEIFHETFREFCVADLGDTREFNERIGVYFEELVGTEADVEGKVEGMYHYRNSESKAAFKRVFDLSVIDALENAGLWSEARRDLKFALKTEMDKETRADTILTLGVIFHKMSEWSKSLDSFKECLEIFEQLGDIHGMAQTYNNMGLVCYRKGEWDKAIEYYEKSVEISEQLGDIHGMAQTYGNMGLVYDKKGEWDKAIEYYKKDLEISEQLGDIHGMAQTYNNMGLVYDKKGEWDKTIEYYKKSVEISEQLGDIHGMAQTYGNMGLVCYRKGEWDKAIEYYKKDLEIFEQLGDIHGMAQTYNNMGLVYDKKGEWDKTIEYYKKSVEISEQLGDIHGMAQTYNNMGLVCYRKGEWDKAIEYYEKSVEISEQLGDIHGMAVTQYGIANIFRDRKEFDDALKLYFKSEKILKNIGDSFNLMNVYLNLTVCYTNMNLQQKAAQYYEKAEELRRKLGVSIS